MLDTIKKEWQAQLIIGIFLLFSLWWLALQFVIPEESILREMFGAGYGIIALLGAIFGFTSAQKWGGAKSLLGKSLGMFSLGLFAQEFGQLAYFYYVFILHIEIPYPSIGDIGYFGSIPCYILGAVFLAKVAGVNVSLKSYKNTIQAIIIPIAILSIGYYLFLGDHVVEFSDPLKVFLDFGYPLGQAFYISIAILTFILTRGILGGLMKSRVLLLIAALIMQFLSDYTFLFQVSRDIWTPNGINDYMYLFSYFIMALSLIEFKAVFKKLAS